jgi:DNA-binding HxlR family transcriptional regulator
MDTVLKNIDYVRPFLAEVSKIIGRRWNFGVLWELRNKKKMRFSQLHESLVGISPSTLTDVLKYLQKEGFIKRTAHGKIPPLKVEYSITDKGLGLIIASSSLIKWTMREKKHSQK